MGSIAPAPRLDWYAIGFGALRIPEAPFEPDLAGFGSGFDLVVAPARWSGRADSRQGLNAQSRMFSPFFMHEP